MEKILIVDDDQGTTTLLEHILSKEGYEVASVNHAGDTVSAARLQHPNLILLDLMMPGKDGLMICRDLRGSSEFSHTPIIFFTSASDIENKVAAFGSGANDYIVKPVHSQELKIRIKSLIGNGKNGNNGHHGNNGHDW
jgi:DNA-binding response OmpR family regulator